MKIGLVRCVALMFIVAVPVLSVAAETAGIPEKAIAAMEYRVGEWKGNGFTDGVKNPEPSTEVTTWEPGKYSIRIRSKFSLDGKDMHTSALVGWDAKKRQLVEHWFWSDGSYASFRYDLGDEENVLVGSFTVIRSDGEKSEGPSRIVVKDNDEWTWSASGPMDGQERTFKSVNRRVK